jgi:hypothetical protein
VAVLIGQGPAWADARTEKAREHYLQGDAYYKLDKYTEALREYEEAYIAKPDPSFLYNIAQCHRLMGDKLQAIKFYRRYLNDAAGAPNRAIAEKHIKELEEALSHGAGTTNDAGRGAAIGPPAPLPLAAPGAMPAAVPSPPPPSPPRAAPESLALGAPPPVEATAPAPTLSSVETPANAAPERARPFYTKWWFWTAVGAVAVGALLVGAAASRDPSCTSGRTCK